MAARPPPLSRPDVPHGGQCGLAMPLPHRVLPVGSGGERGQPAASRGGLPAAGLHLQAPPPHSRARPPAPACFPERGGRLRSRSGQRPWSRTALRAPSGGPSPHSQSGTVPPLEQPYFPIPPHLMCSSISRHSCSPLLQQWRMSTIPHWGLLLTLPMADGGVTASWWGAPDPSTEEAVAHAGPTGAMGRLGSLVSCSWPQLCNPQQTFRCCRDVGGQGGPMGCMGREHHRGPAPSVGEGG